MSWSEDGPRGTVCDEEPPPALVEVTVPGFQRNVCLLRRAQAEPAAFGAFYDEYARRVLVYFARRVVDPETALDLTAETFAKALSQRQQFRGQTPEEEQGWLFAIARSELSHFWRRGAVERRALARIGVEVPALTSAEAERIEELAGLAELAPAIAEAMQQLPGDQRDAVRLRVLDEMGYADMARTLGVSEDVARARVSRGIRALGRKLADSGGVIEGAT